MLEREPMLVGEKPLVSVLLVTYNHAAFVETALWSIEKQKTDFEFEIVVADDSSTDNTLELVEKWAKHSSIPVRVLPPQPRLGITLNYARGFAACRGEYVAVLEGDDQWILSTKLALQADALAKHSGASMVANRLEVFDESSGKASVEPLIGLNDFELLVTSERLADYNWFATFSTCMFRRSALALISPAVFELLAYDWAIVMAITEFGPAIFLPQVAVSYRVHSSGTWSQKKEVERDRQLQLLLPKYIDNFDGRLSRELHRVLLSVERRLAAAGGAQDSSGDEVAGDPMASLGTSEQSRLASARGTRRRMWDGSSQSGLVSVIVPCFNHAEFVARSLHSVLNQTYQNFEVIVVDDASGDDSVSVVEAFTDERIRLLRLPRNVGGAAALNLGIQQARGEFIALLNSDDMWVESKLERQVAVLESNRSLGAVFTNARFVGIDDQPLEPEALPSWGEVFRQPNRTQGQWLRHFFDHGNVLCHPSILVRKEVYLSIGLYDNTLRQLPDYDRWIALVAHAPIAVLGDEPMVLFRLLPNSGNTSSVTPASVRRGMREHLWISETFLDRIPDELIVHAFGDLLDEPTVGPGVERRCDIAVIHLRATGPLQSINREVGLRMLKLLLRDPQSRLVMGTKYGIDDKTVHDRAGLQELALTSDSEELVSDYMRPLLPDPALTSWSTGMLMRLVASRVRNVPVRYWPSRIAHHLGFRPR